MMIRSEGYPFFNWSGSNLILFLTSCGGECLRVLLPKTTPNERRGRTKNESSLFEEEGTNLGSSGYCLQLTYDVPQGTYNGVLHVRACWHEVLYRSDVNFAQNALTY